MTSVKSLKKIMNNTVSRIDVPSALIKKDIEDWPFKRLSFRDWTRLNRI